MVEEVLVWAGRNLYPCARLAATCMYLALRYSHHPFRRNGANDLENT